MSAIVRDYDYDPRQERRVPTGAPLTPAELARRKFIRWLVVTGQLSDWPEIAEQARRAHATREEQSR